MISNEEYFSFQHGIRALFISNFLFSHHCVIRFIFRCHSFLYIIKWVEMKAPFFLVFQLDWRPHIEYLTWNVTSLACSAPLIWSFILALYCLIQIVRLLASSTYTPLRLIGTTSPCDTLHKTTVCSVPSSIRGPHRRMGSSCCNQPTGRCNCLFQSPLYASLQITRVDHQSTCSCLWITQHIQVRPCC